MPDKLQPNFADLFLFFLEAVYVLSQPVKPRACLSVCVPLVYALFKQGSAFPKDILLWKSYYNESKLIHDADNDNLFEVT